MTLSIWYKFQLIWVEIVSFIILKKVHTILTLTVASISEPTELVKIRLKYTHGTGEIFTASGYVICYIFIVYNKTRIKFREVY